MGIKETYLPLGYDEPEILRKKSKVVRLAFPVKMFFYLKLKQNVATKCAHTPSPLLTFQSAAILSLLLLMWI